MAGRKKCATLAPLGQKGLGYSGTESRSQGGSPTLTTKPQVCTQTKRGFCSLHKSFHTRSSTPGTAVEHSERISGTARGSSAYW